MLVALALGLQAAGLQLAGLQVGLLAVAFVWFTCMTWTACNSLSTELLLALADVQQPNGQGWLQASLGLQAAFAVRLAVDALTAVIFLQAVTSALLLLQPEVVCAFTDNKQVQKNKVSTKDKDFMVI